jgi:hypothetical protein
MKKSINFEFLNFSIFPKYSDFAGLAMEKLAISWQVVKGFKFQDQI